MDDVLTMPPRGNPAMFPSQNIALKATPAAPWYTWEFPPTLPFYRQAPHWHPSETRASPPPKNAASELADEVVDQDEISKNMDLRALLLAAKGKIGNEL
jgi:hypothetical protein